MNKQNTRSFASGLLLSAILLIIFSYGTEDKGDSRETLEEQGYVVLTEEEARNQREKIGDLEEQINTLSEDSVSGEQETEVEEDARTEITLTVSSGMTPIEISDELESKGIIKNASDFNSYLVKSGRADKIQIGDYQLHSEMTLEEISTLLTK
ncbi:endolytic transglycosylase MltG [Rossellomorea vietnamensis]|uniref:Endolytic transglycosylase MltG n=1 Tax=Rossellomorea vietnamensis TaxID=218284 RepID=A0A5D4P091_9BACI|nr:endolytic transglycosylase MltG [Rossellomorea vietnamensis]TYS19469.1 endolytic transglycosylase MltG [Rossellomorea vietnamensis]